MKKALVLVAVLGLAVSPAMAAPPVESAEPSAIVLVGAGRAPRRKRWARNTSRAETESGDSCRGQTTGGGNGGSAGGRVHDGKCNGRFR